MQYLRPEGLVTGGVIPSFAVREWLRSPASNDHNLTSWWFNAVVPPRGTNSRPLRSEVVDFPLVEIAVEIFSLLPCASLL